MDVFSDESQKLGRQLQEYLARSGMTRDRLAREVKRSKSTIDKLCSGRYTEKTLAAVLARTKFIPSNAYASDAFGGYSKQSWLNYIGDYIMIECPYPEDGSIWVRKVSIRWVDDFHSGLALEEKGGGEIGRLCIAHERPVLIYIRSHEDDGRYFAVSTMVAEKAMRGIKIGVQKIVANSYAPIVSPVVFRYETDAIKRAFPQAAVVRKDDDRFSRLKADLDMVLQDKFGVIVGVGS